MNIFIDTEFTNVTCPELISIGLITENGKHFYGERNDFDFAKCSEFVRDGVLPLLSTRRDLIWTKAGLKRAVYSWLMKQRQPRVICYDFHGDWDLLINLLGDQATDLSLQPLDVSYAINDLVHEQFFHDTGLPEHHALNDALANQFAFRPNNQVC
jgi:hypothetical protein